MQYEENITTKKETKTKEHGFMKRMKTRSGRNIFKKQEEQKEEKG